MSEVITFQIPINMGELEPLVFRDAAKLESAARSAGVPVSFQRLRDAVYEGHIQEQMTKFQEHYLKPALEAAIAKNGFAIVNGRKLDDIYGYGRSFYRSPTVSTRLQGVPPYPEFVPEWTETSDPDHAYWHINIDDPTVAMMLKLAAG